MEEEKMTVEETAFQILLEAVKRLDTIEDNEKYLQLAPQVFGMCVSYAEEF